MCAIWYGVVCEPLALATGFEVIVGGCSRFVQCLFAGRESFGLGQSPAGLAGQTPQHRSM